MGKVSMVVRSAAMSYIEPWLATILGRGKMRIKFLKIVVVLLLSGSGDARPQRTEESVRPVQEWKSIQEDSRYTWNSGSNRFPYTNYYRSTINPLIDLRAEVSANEPRKSNNFRNSQRYTTYNDTRIWKNSEKFIPISKSKESIEIPHQSTSTSLSDQMIEHNNKKIPRFTSTSVNSSRKSRIPVSNSRIASFGGSSTLTTSPRGFVNSKEKIWRRSGEIVVNNSGSTVSTLGHNSRSEFSDQKEGSSSNFDRNSTKVESTTQFDHVAAIKKITDTLTRENVANVSKNGSNRRWTSKNSNRTKLRRPANKKTPNKTVSNKTNSNKNNSLVQNLHLKNWPNGAIQNAEDFHNYDTYTSLDDDLRPEEAVERPVWLKNSSFMPVSRPSLQEIVHWLKIPAFMTNGSHIVESHQADGPISVAFDPVYQNLEPNRPSRPENLQTFKPGFVYPVYFRPSYTTEKAPSWLGSPVLKNKTVHNPQTHVSQNTVVHLINTDLRKPNRTKVPADSYKPGLSPGSASYLGSSGLFTPQLPSSSTTSKPGPNVHIGFTSYEENKVPDQQKPQTPMVTYDQRCPTILINSYTRINNTIQSKEDCTDLNIIINSQVFNTNTYKTTSSPLSDQIFEEDVSASSYGPFPVYQSGSSPQYDSYNPPKGPQVPQQLEVSNLQVVQDTQISISNSDALNDASSSVESSVGEEEDGSESGTGQAGDSSGGNSLIRPATATADPVSGSSNASPSPSAALASESSPSTSLSNDDDDDDDDYDLSPGGIMESIASIFTYFTFVNPLHYGFFSIAAAPFTAMAAGVLGIATFLYPWLFPSSFGFRANNDVVDGLWTNLEEVVRQSMHKYGGLNEWKSKRKKRKR